MNITQHAPVKLLEKALIVFVGLLLLSLLIIFVLSPRSIPRRCCLVGHRLRDIYGKHCCFWVR
jgi:hypothetical protein